MGLRLLKAAEKMSFRVILNEVKDLEYLDMVRPFAEFILSKVRQSRRLSLEVRDPSFHSG